MDSYELHRRRELRDKSFERFLAEEPLPAVRDIDDFLSALRAAHHWGWETGLECQYLKEDEGPNPAKDEYPVYDYD